MINAKKREDCAKKMNKKEVFHFFSFFAYSSQPSRFFALNICRIRILFVFIILSSYLFSLSSSLIAQAYDPITVYLTWRRDPATTMTVQWITAMNKESDDVYYQKIGENSWNIAVGNHTSMPEGEPFLIHRVELTDLTPDASYLFKTGEWNVVTYKFRTMPEKLDRHIRFVVGGDMYPDRMEHLVETNQQAASVDPMFALIGGDIAYAETKAPRKSSVDRRRWLQWLTAWKVHMVTPGGYLIPMIPAIGNHDTKGRYGQTPFQSPFFYSLFAFPGQQGYEVLDFGDYMSVIVLDSGHTHPIYGDQAHWLYHTLEERQHIPHRFAIYHVPAYPSVRKFKGVINAQIRKHWVPIFEQFGLSAAFEHHDHAYKRTHLIYQGRVDPNGVLYLGDGGWGVKSARQPKRASKEWYLAKTAKARHFIMITLVGDDRYYTAIDEEGDVIDNYAQIKEKSDVGNMKPSLNIKMLWYQKCLSYFVTLPYSDSSL